MQPRQTAATTSFADRELCLPANQRGEYPSWCLTRDAAPPNAVQWCLTQIELAAQSRGLSAGQLLGGDEPSAFCRWFLRQPVDKAALVYRATFRVKNENSPASRRRSYEAAG